jgi:hypothetical protein
METSYIISRFSLLYLFKTIHDPLLVLGGIVENDSIYTIYYGIFISLCYQNIYLTHDTSKTYL